MEKALFTGVCTALITPFSGGGVNYKKLQELLEKQMERNIPAVCLCGTTGEAATLTEEEHLKVLREGVRLCRNKMKVIAGAGSNCTNTTLRRCKQAGDLGADAALVVTPYYNKGNRSGILEHYVKAADHSPCPIIVYNVPSRTGVDLSAELLAELSRHPNIIGCKEASGDLVKTIRLLRLCDSDFAVWSGNDDIIVPMMSVGAKGVISVLSNLVPADTKRMTDACGEGRYEEAAKMQIALSELIDALFCEVNPVPVKRAMNLLGGHVGPTRLPLGGMQPETEARLSQALTKYGLTQ